MATTTLRSEFDLPRHRWLLVVIVAVFALFLIQYLLKTQVDESGTRSAFLRWRTQLQHLDDGVNVWEKFAYPNPPIMAIILKPFMALPPAVGASLWFIVKAILTLASILGVWRLLDSPDAPFPIWGKALAVLPALRPIEGDLVHGNINLLILAMVVATLYSFCHRRDALAGWLLGLSIACKLTPALLVLYFIYKRAWTTLAASLVSVVVFLIVIPGMYFGWQNNVDYLRSWHNQMVAPYAAGIVTSEHKNQSLPGLLHRLLCDEASFSDYAGDRKVVLDTHNIVSWDPRIVQGIIAVCMILFALATLRFCRTPIAGRPRLQLMAEFSVVVLGMLLFCERTWKHHCVTLLLPFGVLAYVMSTPGYSRGQRWYAGGTLGAATLLMLSTTTGVFDRHVDAQESLGKLAQVYGAYVWAFLILLTSMFVVLCKTNPGDRVEDFG